MKISIIGTQGVPANYGGFESLVENIIGENQAPNLEYTIFCSSKDMPDRRPTHKGATLRYIPLHANGMQSIPYDILSMIKSLRGYDTLLILGVSGCLFMPLLRLLCRKRIIVNIDGLEHRRDKWGRLAKWVLRTSEALAVRFADVIIADNKGIADYVRDTYGKEAVMIAYGGDHARRDVSEARQEEILKEYGLKSGKYGVTVCRIEPENNCHITLEAFAEEGKELVFVGNWQHSDYSQALYEKYKDLPGMHLLNAVYDLDVLYTLRRHAEVYVHGHSAGGTNPSLVEAMFFARPIVAFDVVYNRETLHGMGSYFSDAATLRARLRTLADQDIEAIKELAHSAYTWRSIAAEYEALYQALR